MSPSWMYFVRSNLSTAAFNKTGPIWDQVFVRVSVFWTCSTHHRMISLPAGTLMFPQFVCPLGPVAKRTTSELNTQSEEKSKGLTQTESVSDHQPPFLKSRLYRNQSEKFARLRNLAMSDSGTISLASLTVVPSGTFSTGV